MNKMKSKKSEEGSRRYESAQKHGYDLKAAYHTVRLLNEVEQILVEQDLSLTKNNDQLKSIRRGEWTLDQVEKYFVDKEKSLEEVYAKSTLRYGPDEPAIKKILMECLEEHYGSLDGVLQTEDHYKGILRQIQQLVQKV